MSASVVNMFNVGPALLICGNTTHQKLWDVISLFSFISSAIAYGVYVIRRSMHLCRVIPFLPTLKIPRVALLVIVALVPDV